VLSSYLRSTDNLGGASRKSCSTDEIHGKKGSRAHECIAKRGGKAGSNEAESSR